MSSTSYVLALSSLIGYFKCDEGDAATVFYDYISNQPNASTTGTFDPDVKSLTLNSEKTTELYLGANGSLVLGAAVAMGTTFTHAFLYNGSFVNDTVLAKLDSTHYLASVGRKLQINMGGSTSTSATVCLTDHKTHLIGITANGGAAELFVDGIQVHTFSLVGNWEVLAIGTGTPFSTFLDNLATIGEVLFTTAYTDATAFLKLYNNIMADGDVIDSFIDHTHLLAPLVNCRFDSLGTAPIDYGMNADIISGEHRRTSQVTSINRGDPDVTKSLLHEQLLQSYTSLDITKISFCRGISIWFKNSDDSATTLGLMTAYNDSLSDWLTIDGGPFFPTIKTQLGIILPTTPIIDNDVHNILMIQDDVNFTVYIDGVIDTQTASIHIAALYENILMGCNYDIDSGAVINYTNLILGDISLFNTIPAQDEITAYFLAGKSITYTDILSDTVGIKFYQVIYGLVTELISVSSELNNNVTITIIEEEIINFIDLAGKIQKIIIEENINLPLSDIAVGIIRLLKVISEKIGAEELLSNKVNVIDVVIVTLIANDAIYSDGELIIDNVGVSSTLIDVFTAVHNQIESVIFSDGNTSVRTLTLVASDTFAVDDSQSINQILQALIEESFSFVGGLDLNGDQYVAYAVNSKTSAATEYTNYNFNSMSGDLAANSTGIYSLTGDDDDGVNINASFKTGLMDFGNSFMKQIPYAYLGMSSDGRMILKVISVNNGNKKERWYEMRQTNAASGNTRLKFGKGVKASYWQFELANKNGSDFEFERIEFTPLVLKRRVGS